MQRFIVAVLGTVLSVAIVPSSRAEADCDLVHVCPQRLDYFIPATKAIPYEKVVAIVPQEAVEVCRKTNKTFCALQTCLFRKRVLLSQRTPQAVDARRTVSTCNLEPYPDAGGDPDDDGTTDKGAIMVHVHDDPPPLRLPDRAFMFDITTIEAQVDGKVTPRFAFGFELPIQCRYSFFTSVGVAPNAARAGTRLRLPTGGNIESAALRPSARTLTDFTMGTRLYFRPFNSSRQPRAFASLAVASNLQPELDWGLFASLGVRAIVGRYRPIEVEVGYRELWNDSRDSWIVRVGYRFGKAAREPRSWRPRGK